MIDALPRPSAPLEDSAYTLTINEAADRYADAGFPRPIRRIQKYCARGDLECRKVETAPGQEQYLITPESLDRHISYIGETQGTSGRAPTRPDTPERVGENRDEATLVVAAPESAPARRGAPDYEARYVEHLENENFFLREQNTVLLERVKETNILTGRLQEMLTPLLGRSPDSRSAPDSGHRAE